MTHDIWDDVDVLIPRHFHCRRVTAVEEIARDLAALIDALPAGAGDDPLPPASLAEADLEEGRAWITRVIQALSTQADLEQRPWR